MSAYACEPNRGSEPEVGWQWALQMARFHDVAVVTRANNREVIETALANVAPPHPEFIYYDLPAWLVAWKRRGLPVAVYYLLWQAGVRIFLRKQLRSFDLIHHVTFNSFRQPGFWWFCRKPVILGPLGGGQICPWSFVRFFGREKVAESLRSLSVLTSVAFPHLYLSFAAARKILVANSDTARRIPPFFRGKISRLLETGVASDQISTAAKPSGERNVRIVWLGRLEKIKAPELAVRAFAAARQSEPALTLDLVGGGSLEAELKSLALQLEVNQAIHWHGSVPKGQVLHLLAEGDLFLFTSIRDTSGNVLLEAMAAGLPAVTLRHQGAAEIATDATAVRVPVTSYAETLKAVSDAILLLARNPELRVQMGAAARNRVAEVYAWEKKGEQMDAIYREVAMPSQS